MEHCKLKLSTPSASGCQCLDAVCLHFTSELGPHTHSDFLEKLSAFVLMLQHRQQTWPRILKISLYFRLINKLVTRNHYSPAEPWASKPRIKIYVKPWKDISDSLLTHARSVICCQCPGAIFRNKLFLVSGTAPGDHFYHLLGSLMWLLNPSAPTPPPVAGLLRGLFSNLVIIA